MLMRAWLSAADQQIPFSSFSHPPIVDDVWPDREYMLLFICNSLNETISTFLSDMPIGAVG